jgi:serine/threonine protein phosphatase PrpC
MTFAPLLACPACGHAATTADRFCEACGRVLSSSAAQPAEPARPLDRTAADRGHVAAVSDRGLVHERNEDAFLIDDVADRIVAVVCDGVSTSTAPGLAARVGADTAARVLSTSPGSEPETEMQHAIVAARRAVAGIAWSPMRGDAAPSSTIVAATCVADVVTIGSLGDSRAYWVDDHAARRLTRDDSWAEEEVRRGAMLAHEAAADPRAHVITAWLGADAPELTPRVVSFVAPRRGWLFLCSDGLWNSWADAAEFAALVRATGCTAPIALAFALTDRAVAAGGRDNITVVAVDVDPARRPTMEATDVPERGAR